jgi:hypothetical protein
MISEFISREVIHTCGHKETHRIKNTDIEFKFEILTKGLCSDCRYDEWVQKEQHRFSMRDREVYGRM